MIVVPTRTRPGDHEQVQVAAVIARERGTGRSCRLRQLMLSEGGHDVEVRPQRAAITTMPRIAALTATGIWTRIACVSDSRSSP